MNTKRSVFPTIATAAGTLIAATIFTLSASQALAGDTTAATQQPPGAVPAAPPEGASAEPWLPSGAREVVKMHKSGISPDVLVHYVDNSNGPFHLNADAIIYLQQQGVPTKVITEMISRDTTLQQRGIAAVQNLPPGAPPSGAVPMPQTPPPGVNGVYPPGYTDAAPPPYTVAAPDYSYYDYGYPAYYGAYGYPYYWPYWGWGGYWGWGWGRGFHGGGGFRGGGFRGGGGFHGGGHR
jgi:hypothetical protein